MGEALTVFMRWLHISSVATLVGGMIFGGLALSPALKSLSEEARDKLSRQAAAGFRPLILTAIVALLLSGTYNILTNQGHTLRYHILLGVKLLLVAHIFAVALTLGKPEHAADKRGRLMVGAAISGLIVISISAYLRFHY